MLQCDQQPGKYDGVTIMMPGKTPDQRQLSPDGTCQFETFIKHIFYKRKTAVNVNFYISTSMLLYHPYIWTDKDTQQSTRTAGRTTNTTYC